MTKAEAFTGLDLSKWEVNDPVNKEQYYNCDAVIEAYVKGENEGLKKEEKVIFKQFTENVESSKKTISKVLSEIIAIGFIPSGVYLKFNSFDEFECMIAVSVEDFVKDEFLNSFTIAEKIQKEVNTDIYNILFSFMPVDNDDFEESVRYDGFIYSFKRTK
jgi:tartrate dehydratase alpha subunit/fumarate hydratase class I-like protein